MGYKQRFVSPSFAIKASELSIHNSLGLHTSQLLRVKVDLSSTRLYQANSFHHKSAEEAKKDLAAVNYSVLSLSTPSWLLMMQSIKLKGATRRSLDYNASILCRLPLGADGRTKKRTL
jgi:hypothetical protein